MKKKNIFSLFALGLMSLSVLVACVPTEQVDGGIIPEGEYGAGLKFKTTYKSVIGTPPGNMNYLLAPDGSDLQHVANFVDGLVTNDAYGRLVKNLATSVEHEGYQTFTFKIKKNVPWVDHNGKRARGIVNGKMTELKVTAHDFVHTAKQVLTYANHSNNDFMVAMFVEGAAEYAAITSVDSRMPNASPAVKAAAMEKDMKDRFNLTRTVNANQLEQIRRFELVGYKATDDHTLTIKLTEKAPFFPTMLTYAPFLPSNEAFVAETGMGDKGFGRGNELLLYNGPFTYSKIAGKKVHYKKNPLFHGGRVGEDFDTATELVGTAHPVHIEEVIYTVAESGSTEDYTRKLYEAGDIDGFSINSKDNDGWKKYVVGEPDADNKFPGSLEYDPNDLENKPGPVNDEVNARWYDNIDYTWHMNINLNRPLDVSATNQKSMLTDLELQNTNRALKIREVRELFVKSFDFPEYNVRHGNDKIEQTQHQLNTYVPRGFAIDENNKDYAETYYEVYAEKQGLTVEEATAKLEPGQYAGIYLSNEELEPYRLRADKAIELYNENPANTPITFPVKIENIGALSLSEKDILTDKFFADVMDARLNIGLPKGEVHYDLVVNDKMTSSELFSSTVQAGYAHVVTWGWAPDYGDPLSYLNSYVTNGNMAFAVGTAEAVQGYNLNAAGDALETVPSILGKYDDLVRLGADEHEDFGERYRLFAEAEYELLNEVNIMVPLYNNGQGWNASLSKAFGYSNPTSSYGLSSNRLINMWILVNPVKRDKRYEVYDKYLKDKDAALLEGLNIIYDNK